MKKTKREWTKDDAARAATEGWQLASVVDEGKPVSTHYLHVFPCEQSKFKNRNEAQSYLIAEAKKQSAFHMNALTLIQASRIDAVRRRKI